MPAPTRPAITALERAESAGGGATVAIARSGEIGGTDRARSRPPPKQPWRVQREDVAQRHRADHPQAAFGGGLDLAQVGAAYLAGSAIATVAPPRGLGALEPR